MCSFARLAGWRITCSIRSGGKGPSRQRLTFVKHLAQVNDKGEVVRLRARWDDLPTAAKPVLEKFVNERLLIRYKSTAKDKLDRRSVSIEVAHEAMFGCWSDLKEWLRTSADILRWRRDVRRDQANDAKWNGLRPAQLAVARDWPKRRREELAAEEVKWIKRGILSERVRRGIVAIVVLVVALLAGIAWWQKNEAEKRKEAAQVSEKKANDARDQADGLINFMLYNLRDKLVPIGRLDVLNDVARKTKEYLERLPIELVNATRQHQRAAMLNNLGNVLVAQGKLPEALDAYQQSLTIAKRLAEQDKSNPGWQRRLSVGYTKVGDVLVGQGRIQEALEAYEQDLAIAKRLADQDKSNPGWQRDLSVSYNNVGDVLGAEGKLPEALEAYQQSFKIDQTLAEQDKSNATWQRDLTVSYEKVANVLVAQGKLPQGLDAYQRSLKIDQTLAEQDKSNATWQPDLIVCLYRVGIPTAIIGAHDSLGEAQEFLRTALKLTDEYHGPDRQKFSR
jgi:tetratricopeptide (TPR) repeat protein